MTRALCLLALLAGLLWNVRFAIADLAARKNRLQATRLALQLIPENPSYSAQFADEVYVTDPVAAKALLQRALKQNRYDAPHWIQLGLLSEGADELPQAETALLAAANIDATYLPSWSLANFYFRHGQSSQFWYWAQKAAHMAPDDAAPLFRLAWYTSADAGEVERRLQLNQPGMAAQWVKFLIKQGDTAAVTQAATRLLGADSPVLPRVCDWLIAQHRADLALPLWNRLAARGRAPEARPGTVTNGDFDQSPLSLGFDWRLQTVDGVTWFLNSNPSALGFEFSGDEPDGLVLLTQTVAVQAHKDYSLTAAYSTENIEPGSGVTWQVRDARSDAMLARTGSLASPQGGQATACFTAPAEGSFVNLVLAYQRQPGTVRVAGKLALHSVRLLAGLLPGSCAG